jgi:hypothetical protein
MVNNEMDTATHVDPYDEDDYVTPSAARVMPMVSRGLSLIAQLLLTPLRGAHRRQAKRRLSWSGATEP